MLGLEIIRFILFCICYLFGWRVWIFPDLDRDDNNNNNDPFDDLGGDDSFSDE